MNDKLLIRVVGDNRVISPEVLLRHIGQALRGIDLPAGDHFIETDSEGGVWLDGTKVYTPARRGVAKK